MSRAPGADLWLPFLLSGSADEEERERETGPGERRPLCVVAGDWKEIIGDCETVKIMERGGQARMADPLFEICEICD